MNAGVNIFSVAKPDFSDAKSAAKPYRSPGIKQDLSHANAE